ncbi:unnamed protein product [Closterium sp. NIES-54]
MKGLSFSLLPPPCVLLPLSTVPQIDGDCGGEQRQRGAEIQRGAEVRPSPRLLPQPAHPPHPSSAHPFPFPPPLPLLHQVLRYNVGQKYVPHLDYFSDPPETLQGGQRLATVLMYLSNVTLGGETVFSNVPDPTPKDHSWSDCAKGYLAVKPVKGDALLFFSMHPDGTPDEASMHYACPVVEGVKWSAPKWIHVREFDVPGEEADPNVCADTNRMCAEWAAAGECEKNSKYMVGGKRFVGACRKACGVCTADSTNGTAAGGEAVQTAEL